MMDGQICIKEIIYIYIYIYICMILMGLKQLCEFNILLNIEAYIKWLKMKK